MRNRESDIVASTEELRGVSNLQTPKLFERYWSEGDRAWSMGIGATRRHHNRAALAHFESANRAYLNAIFFRSEGRPDWNKPADKPLGFMFYLKLAATQTRLAADPALSPYSSSDYERHECLFGAAAHSYEFALDTLPQGSDDPHVVAAESLVFSQRADMYEQWGRLDKAELDLSRARIRTMDEDQPLEIITERIETQELSLSETTWQYDRFARIQASTQFLAQVVASHEFQLSSHL